MTYANESFLNPVSDDVYHLRGRMPAKSKRTWGCFDQCAADGGIEWDLTVTRRLGWFGEEGTFEKLSKWAGKGMLGWVGRANAPCDVDVCSLRSAHANLTINMQLSHYRTPMRTTVWLRAL
jgi:hypothetical protein